MDIFCTRKDVAKNPLVELIRPGLFVEEATQARPRGKTGMFIFSVLAEIKRTRMILLSEL